MLSDKERHGKQDRQGRLQVPGGVCFHPPFVSIIRYSIPYGGKESQISKPKVKGAEYFLTRISFATPISSHVHAKTYKETRNG